ncbi:hypothetical protein DFH08DRAFT_1087155 [Mycena albidolilacea]|uniref:Uncharacterized protein n=1 Tax=Mycena albidolilacea TaxID=1033008 RepID=A0AAD6ZAG0_9AGAR|nr:hypothetical protein DFH08DRAFT_1087155 [Mycena albidolilacea]
MDRYTARLGGEKKKENKSSSHVAKIIIYSHRVETASHLRHPPTQMTWRDITGLPLPRALLPFLVQSRDLSASSGDFLSEGPNVMRCRPRRDSSSPRLSSNKMEDANMQTTHMRQLSRRTDRDKILVVHSGDEDKDHDSNNDNEVKSDKNDDMTRHGLERHLSARSTRKPSPPVSGHGSPWLGPLVDRNENTIYLHMLDPCDYSSDEDDPSSTRRSASAGALIKSLPSAMGYFAPEPVPQCWTNRICRQLSLSFDVCFVQFQKLWCPLRGFECWLRSREDSVRSMTSILVQLARYMCVLIQLDGGERRMAATFLV